MNKKCELFNLEAISHVVIIAVLLLVSVVYGTKGMSEKAVPVGRKEMAHQANAVVKNDHKELLASVDVSFEPMEQELKPEALKTETLKVETMKEETSKSEILTPVTETVATVDTNVSVETVKPEEIIVPSLTCEGELRTDYCIGSTIDLSGIKLLLDEKEILLEECMVEGLDTANSGEHYAKITYGDYSVEIPYTVVDYKVILHGAGEEQSYTLINYELDTEAIAAPARLGKEFTGWYRDEAGTVPFVTALPGEVVLDLYAGWKEFDRFACDEAGYITSYTGGYGSITDGLLNLTAHPSCIGVRADAFVNLEEFVTDIYIPANITHIESGAFDCLPYVFYIYVHPDNPVYSSDAGILYTKDMSTVVAYPSCR